MYKYKPISDIYIRNFRCLGDVQLSFKDCPIITLLGDNEAGKTSVVKAFSVCALHTNPRDQKDYIRDNTSEFGVAIELNDGTRIVRRKGDTVNLYSIVNPDGSREDFPKLAEGLPTEVQKLMGLIEEPETGELLHIRMYEDKLLFVESKSSDNYKVMYNALKVENITRAIKSGSQEVNKLKSCIKTNELSIETLHGQIQGIKTYDIENLLLIKNSIKQELEVLNLLNKCKKQLDRINELNKLKGALKLIEEFNLDTVDEVLASKLNVINRIYNRYNEVINYKSVIDEIGVLDEIDTRVLNSIIDIKNKMGRLEKVKSENLVLSEATTLQEIDENLIKNICSIIDSKNKLIEIRAKVGTDDISSLNEISTSTLDKIAKAIQCINTINNDNQQIEPLKNDCTQIENYMKQCGVAVETCSQCGNTIIFDIDKVSL